MKAILGICVVILALIAPAVEMSDATSCFKDSLVFRGSEWCLRSVLAKAANGETVKVAVMGGSITEGAKANGREYQWGEMFAKNLQAMFPRAKIEFLNAAVGATGSLIGAFRYGKDVSPFHPDLLVLEFAVNDSGCSDAKETMEGIVRHAMREGAAVMMLGMINAGSNEAEAPHLQVAKKYDIPFVSYRAALRPRLDSKVWKWSDFQADNVHPNRRGHALAAALMTLYVRDVWDKSEKQHPFENGEFICFAEVKITENTGFAPYTERSWGQGLEAKKAGCRLAFDFEGSKAAILYRLGNQPIGKAKIVVDGKEIARPCGHNGYDWWYTPSLWLVNGVAGRHHVEVETLPADDQCKFEGFRLAVLMLDGKVMK